MESGTRRAPRGLALAFNWKRVAFTLLFSFSWGALFGLGWTSGWWGAVVRFMGLGLILMLVFGLFEQWPGRLPHWLPRWLLQVAAVAACVPIVTVAMWIGSTDPGDPPFWEVQERMAGFGTLTGFGLLMSPWVALGALVRQKEALAREQALALGLAQSEMARHALDARLSLLQAQVAPHFLFNTLANVQALVERGSPQAPAVLRSLIAYLRAAVPRLDDTATTVGHELDLVRAYLDLMRMRMPDRLQFGLKADDTALSLRCPPMTLLTLVENAVRHGIDPSEDGGRIDVEVRCQDGRCKVLVADDGEGLQAAGQGLGTGLAALRERLALTFGESASLAVQSRDPRGVVALVQFPMRAEDR
ncbi:MAG: sensor histidine kinase [Steroidobacteraceae bacterium]